MKLPPQVRLNVLRLLCTYLVLNVLIEAGWFLVTGGIGAADTCFTWTWLAGTVWAVQRLTPPARDHTSHEVAG